MATIEQRIYDGSRAKEILDNEVFSQVFEDIEKELYEAWKSAPQRDAAGREAIHQYLTMLQKVKSNLTTVFETGKLARLDLDHKQKLADRAKEFLGMQ